MTSSKDSATLGGGSLTSPRCLQLLLLSQWATHSRCSGEEGQQQAAPAFNPLLWNVAEGHLGLPISMSNNVSWVSPNDSMLVACSLNMVTLIN